MRIKGRTVAALLLRTAPFPLINEGAQIAWVELLSSSSQMGTILTSTPNRGVNTASIISKGRATLYLCCSPKAGVRTNVIRKWFNLTTLEKCFYTPSSILQGFCFCFKQKEKKEKKISPSHAHLKQVEGGKKEGF